MPNELHERARLLLDRTVAKENVIADDQRWLSEHLSHCAACSQYAELSQRTVRALDSFAFELDPEAALRVQRAVRNKAMQLASREQQFSMATPAAIAMTILGSVAVWQFLAWMAVRSNWPAPTWQIGFAALWLMPSILLDVWIVFRRNWVGNDDDVAGSTDQRKEKLI